VFLDPCMIYYGQVHSTLGGGNISFGLTHAEYSGTGISSLARWQHEF